MSSQELEPVAIAAAVLMFFAYLLLGEFGMWTVRFFALPSVIGSGCDLLVSALKYLTVLAVGVSAGAAIVQRNR